MPEAEAARLRECYAQAQVILEYGSGGSTELAASLPGKLVISVESDRAWARDIRKKLRASLALSPSIVHFVDIGRTGTWGRAVDSSGWQRYHEYPNSVWDAPFFREPDVVLVDGRFRTACLMTVMMRTRKPVTVLFDDYLNRPRYHLVEEIAPPLAIIGRMAEFRIEPGMVRQSQIGYVISQFFQTTFAERETGRYDIKPEDAIMAAKLRASQDKEQDS